MADTEWGVQRPEDMQPRPMLSLDAAVKYVAWYNTRRPVEFQATMVRREVSEWVAV